MKNEYKSSDAAADRQQHAASVDARNAPLLPAARPAAVPAILALRQEAAVLAASHAIGYAL